MDPPAAAGYGNAAAHVLLGDAAAGLRVALCDGAAEERQQVGQSYVVLGREKVRFSTTRPRHHMDMDDMDDDMDMDME